MKTRLTVALSALACLSAAKAPAPTSSLVTGDYVEARTCSVFAGACHYNGERVTSGRNAVLAWHVTAGTWHGTDLAGIRAVAAVASEQNLADAAPDRQSELRVDGTPAQAAAFADLLAARGGSALGHVVSVTTGPVTFDRTAGRAYRVAADGFAALSIQPMPNDACCSQPHNVWYEPLMSVPGRKVGYADRAAYTAGRVGDAWDRSEENDAFYGAFKL